MLLIILRLILHKINNSTNNENIVDYNNKRKLTTISAIIINTKCPFNNLAIFATFGIFISLVCAVRWWRAVRRKPPKVLRRVEQDSALTTNGVRTNDD